MNAGAARARLAILGPGDVAGRDYLPEFHRIADRAEIVAVCGRGEERARVTGGAIGVPWFTDPGVMFDAIEMDAVVNLTPIPVHEETTMAALEAGLHVYSEKPLGMSVDGARRLRDEAAARGLVLVAAPSVLVFPQVRRARELLADGAIGAVHTVRGLGFGGVPPWEGYGSDPGPFFAPGAGPLVDLGVYPLHAITGLLGPARRVSAMSARTREAFDITEGPLAGQRVPVDVDDAWVMTLDLGERRLATVEANFTAHGSRSSELELMGDGGTIAFSLLDVAAPMHVLDTGGVWTTLEVETGRPAGGPDHILGVEHLVECIRGDASPVLSADHAIHVIEILHAAVRSAADGSTVDLRTSFDLET
ncbi:MAG TPA: Gfo/Idh/MocA family oxidoreductase [Actinomycetota bacterium]